MTTVVCAACGTQTSVPFVPRLDRPGYCNACFEKVRSGATEDQGIVEDQGTAEDQGIVE
jgi:CxxC-x17-CxxC domain-containing protein